MMLMKKSIIRVIMDQLEREDEVGIKDEAPRQASGKSEWEQSISRVTLDDVSDTLSAK